MSIQYLHQYFSLPIVQIINFEKGNFESNLVHLYGYDDVSHHTVCEIKIANKFLLFDPFHRLFFKDTKGDLATITDIQNNTFTTLPTNPELPAGYLKLFAKKHPYRIHRRNNIHKKIDGWYYLHKDYFLKPYLQLYFFLEKTSNPLLNLTT